jgi:hypothetical protein
MTPNDKRKVAKVVSTRRGAGVSRQPLSKEVTVQNRPRQTGSRERTKPKGVKSQRRDATTIFAGVHDVTSKPATLLQILSPEVPTRMDKDLALHERAALAIARIKATKHFVNMRTLGTSGVIDKKRAILEIEKLSSTGLHLLEIDRRHIRLQLEEHIRSATKAKEENP